MNLEKTQLGTKHINYTLDQHTDSIEFDIFTRKTHHNFTFH